MEDFSKLEVKRTSVKRQLKSFFSFVNTSDSDLLQLQERYERIPEVWSKFQELQLEMEVFLQEPENLTKLTEHISNGLIYENSYYEAMSISRRRIEEEKTKSLKLCGSDMNQEDKSSILKVKLPPITIQPFTGDYSHWLSFQDSFKKAVHEKDVPKVQKFQLLKGLLKEDALRLISALEATDENYDAAWGLLENRYSNKRLIMNTHMKGLFDLTPISKATHTNLRQLVDQVRMHIRSLGSLEQPVNKWDTILIYLIMSKLDVTTKEEWEREFSDQKDDEDATLEEFLKFLEKRCIVLEMTDNFKTKQQNTVSTLVKKDKKVTLSVTQRQGSTGCPQCKGTHSLFKCEKFLKMTPQDRYQAARKMSLCINCLGAGHQKRQCRSSGCRKCSMYHNTFLHYNREHDGKSQESNKEQEKDQQFKQENDKSSIITHCAPALSRVILSTAEVFVTDVKGQEHRCRALLDPGSQSNLVTGELAKKLKLKLKQVNVPISGVDRKRSFIRHSVQVKIRSTISRFTMDHDCLIISSITENLPQVYLDPHQIRVPEGIDLADPNFNKPGPIDILLGAAIFWKIFKPGESISYRGQPVFQNTDFGWVVGGEYSISNQTTAAQTCLLSTSLEQQIEKFWKLEEVGTKEDCDPEDYCENHFLKTHKRSEDGRFKVRLPKNCEVNLGDSFNEAVRRLRVLERRFIKMPELKFEYKKFLEDYETAQHMSKLQDQNVDNKEVYYLPHQAIIRKESLTTKMRVVFDASCKTTNGHSLNDKLFAGPNLQNELFDILLRFRSYEYVLTADIRQMFRQVMVDEEDRHLQRIVWREDETKPIQIYTLNTVTYGTSCAPFLAMRCLRQLATEMKEKLPGAATVLKEDFYMDDLLTGTNTIEDAMLLRKQLSYMLESGKFCLRKWRTNNSQILEDLRTENNENLLILDRESVKTLGLQWNSKSDYLEYHIHIPDSTKLNKRLVLSTIAKIYDPLGILGPVLVTSKLFMQKLWTLNLTWDEELPIEVAKKWTEYVHSLNTITDMKFGRNVNPGNSSQEVILHGFGDASEKAYGACLYVTSKNQDGQYQTHLLCSKSKVAPLKKQTLPRLELCAALLLSRLLTSIQNALRLKIVQTHLWSDSTIALCWIATPPRNLKTFVSNRVVEIQEKTHDSTWHYVPSGDNPADHLSRGVSPAIITDLNIWWHGPEWIHEEEKWPEQFGHKVTEVPEQKSVVIMTVSEMNSKLLRRFSSFLKLTRVVAYCYRFIAKVKAKIEYKKLSRNETTDKIISLNCGPLAVEEIEKARIKTLRWLQEETFPLDIQQLEAGKTVHRKSPLFTLCPFLDKDGLIKVGGRLRRAIIPEEQKHPVLLPAKHPLTESILRQEHIKLLHCGAQQLLFSIRQRYWPLSGTRTARKITRSCVACFRYKPKSLDPIMADLPSPRVNVPIYPFETTGVDYAGPIKVRESRRRGRIHISKGYVVVFVCFASKAVRLELVSDLSTESFLSALQRFNAQQRSCTTMYSDNGTNFVGAANELREILQFLQNNEDTIKTRLSIQGITWKFIPPRSPHFGGLWEAAVKSMKKHLLTVTKGLNYTFEEYYSLLKTIESVLNSRPLTPVSNDPNDLSVLTPFQLITGTPPLEPPTKCYIDVPDGRLSRWQHLQKLRQHYWKRWSSEYLHQLQARNRGKPESSNLKVGSMVLLMNDNAPPMSWPLGRITKIFPGADGIIRVAEVQTNSGIYERSVKRLCLLPLES